MSPQSPTIFVAMFFSLEVGTEERRPAYNVYGSQYLPNFGQSQNILYSADMSLDQDFEAAAESIKNLTKRPADDELLELYALFKQASVGDVNTSKPGMLDLKGKAKWNQWSSKKGMSKDAAKQAYVAYAKVLLDKYQ